MLPLCLALLAAAPPDAELSAGERGLLSVVVVAPAGRMQSTTRSDMLRSIGNAARLNTNLVVQELQNAEPCLDQTQGGDRLRCLAIAAGADAEETTAPFFLIVSVLRTPKEDRLSAMLVDSTRANEIVVRTGPENADQAGVDILREAVRASVPQTAARDADEIEIFVRKMFDQLRPVFSATGFWGELGTIDIEVDRAGLEISLDGKTLPGVTAKGRTRIVEVREGKRTLKLSGGNAVPVSTTMVIERNVTATWNPVIEEVVVSYANDVVFWSGVGVGVAGVALAVVGIATPARTRSHCYQRNAGDRCEDLNTTFRSFDGRTGSVGAGQVAIGLVTASVTTLVLNLFLAEDGRFPWLEIVGGVVAGGIGFGGAYLINEGFRN